MSKLLNKASLYTVCTQIRTELGIHYSSRIRNVAAFLQLTCRRLKVEAVPFQTPALHGVCSFGHGTEPDIVLLNSHRTAIEQNFDCMHEFFHLHEHRAERKESFCCYDRVTDKQDSILEWQANEGAAELLVPYQDFIPRFVVHIDRNNPLLGTYDIQESLARYYAVSVQVINNRIDGLSYEICQYQSGVPLDCLEILSKRKQNERGIKTPAYRAMCSFPLSWDCAI